MCSTSIPYSGNTTNLSYHVRKYHPVHVKHIEDSVAKGRCECSEPGLKQLSLQAILNKVKTYPKDSQRHQFLVDAVGKFICYGLQPISVADDVSFRKLMMKADSKFNLPSRTYFSRHVIPGKYEAVKCKIKNELSKSKFCAITTDLWTSQHQCRSYISLTTHFITGDFQLRSRCLQTKEIFTNHSAVSIAELLRYFISEWKIDKKSICSNN